MSFAERAEGGEIKLTIPGKPIAKKRPRFFRKGSFVGTYNDQRTEEGRWLFEAQRQIDRKIENKAIAVEMCFFMPIPKSTSKKKRELMIAGQIYHTKKPDIDNLQKWVLDCLNGVAWGDDSSVVWVEAKKAYSEEPKTEIKLMEF